MTPDRPPARPVARAAAGRGGFTLIELLTVTVIIGILALIGAGTFDRLRQKAMTTAAKAELQQARTAIERYRIVYAAWPGSVEDLESVDYSPSPDIRYCTFEFVPASGSEEARMVLTLAHRSANSALTTEYPAWGSRADELPTPGGCPSP